MEILVVDDDRRVVKTTCDILKIKGHEAIAAFSGEEGVEKIKNSSPDCVLMDIKMQGIDGVEAMKQMKQLDPKLPVILVSAYVTDESMEEAKRAGAYAILSKPLNLPMILAFFSLACEKENILVVDDDPEFCKTLQDILNLRGFHVETVNDPQRVMGHLEHQGKLAVVLLDLKLGTVDGVEVLKNVRAKYLAIPVLLMTGYRQEMGDSIEKARQLGIHTCLYKPFEMDDLFRVIDEIKTAKLKEMLATA